MSDLMGLIKYQGLTAKDYFNGKKFDCLFDETTYLLLVMDGFTDDHVIRELDCRLGNELYKKSQCPSCGEEFNYKPE